MSTSTEPLPEPDQPLPEPTLSTAPAPLALPPPMTQTEIRHWAFAKRVCETADVAEAYRDVYAPGDALAAYHHQRGAAMLKVPEVGKIVAHLAAPTLVELGVEKNHVLRRLLETIDADISDYFNENGAIMDGLELRTLPFAKRRLVKKIKEKYHAVTGVLLSREIELEPKHPAMQLLAAIQQWIKPAGDTYINHENIVTFMTLAQKDAAKRVDELRQKAADSGTARQMSRPILNGEFKQVAPSAAPAQPAPRPAVVAPPRPAAPPAQTAPQAKPDKLADYRGPTQAQLEQSGTMESD